VLRFAHGRSHALHRADDDGRLADHRSRNYPSLEACATGIDFLHWVEHADEQSPILSYRCEPRRNGSHYLSCVAAPSEHWLDRHEREIEEHEARLLRLAVEPSEQPKKHLSET
jgi:hypothetical protein